MGLLGIIPKRTENGSGFDLFYDFFPIGCFLLVEKVMQMTLAPHEMTSCVGRGWTGVPGNTGGPSRGPGRGPAGTSRWAGGRAGPRPVCRGEAGLQPGLVRRPLGCRSCRPSRPLRQPPHSDWCKYILLSLLSLVGTRALPFPPAPCSLSEEGADEQHLSRHVLHHLRMSSTCHATCHTTCHATCG